MAIKELCRSLSGRAERQVFTEELEKGSLDESGLSSARGRLLRELGLPGGEYARVLASQRLQVSGDGYVAFRLHVDDGTYGPQWDVIVAVCTCSERHAVRGEFTVSLEWLSNPWEPQCD